MVMKFFKTSTAKRRAGGDLVPDRFTRFSRSLLPRATSKRQAGARSADRKVYSITPNGLEFIKEDEKMLRNSGRNWMAMRRLFVELIQPEDMLRFMSEGTKGQFELTQEIISSKMNVIPPKDREFVLKEYVLNLERQTRMG